MWARNFYGYFSPAFALFVTALGILVVIGVVGGRSYRTLRVGDVQYKLVAADSDAERSKGLGGRAHMPAHEGMVFMYDNPGQRCFWMKDMHFSLDILWLDAQKTVTHMRTGISPQTYPEVFCAGNSQYVIELRGGEAERRHVRQGQQLAF